MPGQSYVRYLFGMSDNPVGRPSTYTDEIADAICECLAKGESLNAICARDEMPPESTVRSWALDDREGFFAKYARARTIQAHRMFDGMLDIADDGTNDTYVDEQGNPRTDHDVIARSKLRIDTRKWYLSKVLPKVYGDKVAMEHTGADGGPIETKELSDDELMSRLAAVNNRIAAHLPKPSKNGHG